MLGVAERGSKEHERVATRPLEQACCPNLCVPLCPLWFKILLLISLFALHPSPLSIRFQRAARYTGAMKIGAASSASLLLTILLPALSLAAGTDPSTLTLLNWQAPTIVNAHLSIGSKDLMASRIVYEPLATFDTEGDLVPFLAAEIPSLENRGVAADGLSVTWKLKPGVRWADGEPFTAADVAFTYEYATNPAVGATTRATYDAIERVEVIDDHAVRLHFRDVNPAWALPFVGANGVILPEHLFADYNGANAQENPANRLAVGTGPFKVTEFVEEDILIIGDDVVSTVKIVYDVNPHYYVKGKPHFSRVVLRGGGDAESAARASLQDGTVDFSRTLQIPPAMLDELEALGIGRVEFPPTAWTERIMINFTDPNRATAEGERSSLDYPHPILSDLRVRQALSLAIDRDAIAALYGRAGKVATNLLISPGRYASKAIEWHYDPERAASLLDDAGWADSDRDGVREKDGRRLSLVFQTSVNSVRQATQEMVKASLGEIGIEVEIKSIDSSIFFGPPSESTNTRRHFYADLEEFAFSNKSPDPGAYMRAWTCGAAAQMSNNWSGANWSRYCNPEFDALYERSTTEMNPDEREALFVRMNEVLAEDVAVIPLVERKLAIGVSNRIAPFALTAWDVRVWNIRDWQLAE